MYGDRESQGALSLIYPRILGWGEGCDNYTLSPGLVASWYYPEANRLRLHLQKEAWWQRQGERVRRVSAADLRSSLVRALVNMSEGWARLLAGAELEVVDELTLDIVTRVPFYPLLPFLASDNLRVMPQEGPSLDPLQALGSGPFYFAQGLPGLRQRFLRNPLYWGRDEAGRTLPYVEGVDLIVLPDPATRRAAIMVGKLELVPWATPQERKEARLYEGRIQATECPGRERRGLSMGVSFPPFQDREVRLAVAQAVDRQGFIEAFLGGEGVKEASPLAPFMEGWLPLEGYPPQARAFFEFSPEVARRLLGGERYKVDLYLPQGPPWEEEAAFLAHSLGEVGMEAKLHPLSPDEFYPYQRGAYSSPAVLVYGSRGSPFFAYDALAPVYRSGGERNSGGISDPLLDGMIDRYALLLGAQGGARALRELQIYLATEALDLPLPLPLAGSLYSPRVRGLSPKPASGELGMVLERAFLER